MKLEQKPNSLRRFKFAHYIWGQWLPLSGGALCLFFLLACTDPQPPATTPPPIDPAAPAYLQAYAEGFPLGHEHRLAGHTAPTPRALHAAAATRYSNAPLSPIPARHRSHGFVTGFLTGYHTPAPDFDHLMPPAPVTP